MERHSEHSGKFIRELCDAAQEVAAQDFTVASLHADWALFGSWIIEVRKHREAVRFIWDGRDGFLTVESSPLQNWSYPNEWKQEQVRGFDVVKGENPVQFVSEYLSKRLPL
jgi:hypothetical protein